MQAVVSTCVWPRTVNNRQRLAERQRRLGGEAVPAIMKPRILDPGVFENQTPRAVQVAYALALGIPGNDQGVPLDAGNSGQRRVRT